MGLLWWFPHPKFHKVAKHTSFVFIFSHNENMIISFSLSYKILLTYMVIDHWHQAKIHIHLMKLQYKISKTTSCNWVSWTKNHYIWIKPNEIWPTFGHVAWYYIITLQCYHHKTLTSLGAHYITTTLNMDTRNVIHVIAIYKPTT
jgi:hypothetical protein